MLLAADAELSDELREHLAACHRCRTLRHHLLDRAGHEEMETDTPELSKEPIERKGGTLEPVAGGVYAIHGPLSDEYLIGALVDCDEEEAVVVPISEDARFSTNWDLLLEEALLGYPAIAEVWNHGTVLVEQLEERIADLGELTSALEALYEAALGSRDVPTGLRVSAPVLDEADPRLLFQEEEGERAAIYWQPATLLASVESVAELVRLQREELGLAHEALEAVVEAETLGGLEQGTLDVFARVPVDSFVALMNRLALEPSRRLEELIRSAVESTFTEPLEQAPALYRKRRGMRKPKRLPDKGRVAEEYARAVIEGMKQ